MTHGHKHAAWRSPVKAVVLHHTCGDDSHYDLMIEDPASDQPEAERPLCTWRIAEPPADWARAGTMTLRRLGDHRRAYLDYEGPISGDRGHVRRIDAGAATIVSWGADAAAVDLALREFSGRMRMRREDGARWSARVVG